MDKKIFKRNRTTISIYNAIFELLELHTFDNITVNDICKKAMVSRTTFYSYFTDKYELIIFCLQEERNEVGILENDNMKNNLVVFLNRFKEREIIYKNLIISQSNRELNKMLMIHFNNFIKEKISKMIGDIEKLEVQTIIFTSGIAGSIIWWIENKFPIAVEKFAEYQYDLIDRIVQSTI